MVIRFGQLTNQIQNPQGRHTNAPKIAKDTLETKPRAMKTKFPNKSVKSIIQDHEHQYLSDFTNSKTILMNIYRILTI